MDKFKTFLHQNLKICSRCLNLLNTLTFLLNFYGIESVLKGFVVWWTSMWGKNKIEKKYAYLHCKASKFPHINFAEGSRKIINAQPFAGWQFSGNEYIWKSSSRRKRIWKRDRYSKSLLIFYFFKRRFNTRCPWNIYDYSLVMFLCDCKISSYFREIFW